VLRPAVQRGARKKEESHRTVEKMKRTAENGVQ